MSTYITLTPDNFQASIEEAALLINAGGIGVIAAEHGYMYVANAFDHEAVRNIHILRGDPAYTASQVIVGSADVLSGIATDFEADLRSLTDAFWPGLLTIQVAANASLNWDLGDGGTLAEFAVRVPAQNFLRTLASKTGPLAVASAAIAGSGPSHEIQFIPAHESAIAIYVDEGALVPGPASTLVRRQVLGKPGGLIAARVGAISLAQLQAILPTLGPSAT
jgi:L-threonylcarbamoyladenylate synthase